MSSDAAFGEILAEVLHEECGLPPAAQDPRPLPTEATLIEQLIGSTHNVFATMCSLTVAMDGAPTPGCAVNHFELTGVIGLVGTIRATVAIGLPRELAFRVVEKLIGVCPQGIDADVIDTVGELANIIVGTTKRGLGDGGLSIEIPKVIFGQGHRVTFGTNMNLYVLRFLSECGPFQIEIGIDVPR
jgi:chemotaxis protein CheX